MYKKIVIYFFLLFSPTLLLAQSKHTVSGTVKEKSSGETLIGVSISAEGTTMGVITNEYGFYSLSLPEGDYTLHFSYVGYNTELVSIKLNSNITANVDLSEGISLQEVVVTSRKEDDNLTTTAMGTEVLNMKVTAKVPVLFGEKDLVKTIQLMPGLKSNGEGSNGFSVRGGATDQNLILLDEAPVYCI